MSNSQVAVYGAPSAVRGGVDGISSEPQNFLRESVAMSNRPLTADGGPLAVRGGLVAFLRDPKNIFWSSWQCPTARLQWTEHLWQCAEGRLHFTGASKYFLGARCNGQRPVRNVPRGFGSARNADHTSPKPVDTVSELDALCRRPIGISEDRWSSWETRSLVAKGA